MSHWHRHSISPINVSDDSVHCQLGIEKCESLARGVLREVEYNDRIWEFGGLTIILEEIQAEMQTPIAS